MNRKPDLGSYRLDSSGRIVLWCGVCRELRLTTCDPVTYFVTGYATEMRCKCGSTIAPMHASDCRASGEMTNNPVEAE